VALSYVCLPQTFATEAREFSLTRSRQKTKKQKKTKNMIFFRLLPLPSCTAKDTRISGDFAVLDEEPDLRSF
jgi:hypothetical protein